jgi:hypothetical protein
MEKIEIGGKWYKLVPIEKEEQEEELEDLTFYYVCETPNILFRFSVLLDDNGDIWGDTQSLTIKKEGFGDNYWDSPDYLRGILLGEKDEELEDEGFTKKEIKQLKFLLESVRNKGWMISR